MVDIIENDILTAFRQYIPYAMLTGVILFFVGFIILRLLMGRKVKEFVISQKKKLLAVYITYIYYFCVVGITFLSREPGSRNSLDLRLFSTFSKNLSDNIFPIENILLFIPLGFLLPLLANFFHHFLHCVVVAFMFSLMIETSQYITQRGFFQIDDLFTNTIGSLIGYVIYCITLVLYRKLRYRKK